MNKITSSNFGQEFTALGYDLYMHARDCLGQYHKYMIAPANGMGGISYFDSLSEMRKHIARIREIRAMYDAEQWTCVKRLQTFRLLGVEYVD